MPVFKIDYYRRDYDAEPAHSEVLQASKERAAAEARRRIDGFARAVVVLISDKRCSRLKHHPFKQSALDV